MKAQKRVICIKTTFYVIDGDVSILYGTVYKVNNVIDSKDVINLVEDAPPNTVPADGDWYELDGLRGFHHESNFIELPEDLYEKKETKKEEYGTM
jgi:hypothetical protein